MKISPRFPLAALLSLSPLLHASPSLAEVVRPAPELSVRIGENLRPLKTFQGQQIVLLLADSPSTRAFRRQVREIETLYDRFAASRILFLAAFRSPTQDPVASNIPFLVSNPDPTLFERYGIKSKFGIAIIGADGNLDCVTAQELSASRIREVLQNSFTVQKAARRS